MSEVTLVLLDADRAIHGTCHGSVAEAVNAALSADPETIEELEVAVGRFIRPGEGRGPFSHFRKGDDDRPWDAGVVVVDLAARLIATENTYFAPCREAEIAWHNGKQATDTWIPFRVPDDWLFVDAMECWRGRSRRRREERAATPPLDARQVLYGKVAAFIAAECLAARAAAGVPAGQDPIAAIHARWLMTPREDMRGQCPRDLLLARQNFLALDMQWREMQWSFTGECPPGLSPESAACRFSGFGVHENVLYYEMIRYLLGECWPHLAQAGDMSQAEESARLERLQQEWLTTPQEEDLHGLTPFFVIANERSRQPLALSRKQVVIDDDCPLCQMLGDSKTPTFWHLDGSSMDDDFPFSFHETREEWEEERRSWGEHLRSYREEEDVAADRGEQPSVWDSSFSDDDALDDIPPGEDVNLALFGIGGHLGELGRDLRHTDEGAAHADSLNQHFAELRDAVESDMRWLEKIVVRQFQSELADAGAENPSLVAKCVDLSRQLGQLGERV